MIFLTVGTQFPFDRLLKGVDDLLDAGVLDEDVFAQMGDSSYQPRNFSGVRSLEKGPFDEYLQKASAVIGHAGIGTITMALDNHKPLLAMPRLKRYGEVVNDHQLILARKFEALGYLLVAEDQPQLAAKAAQLKSFVPQPRKADPDRVAQRVLRFLDELNGH